MDGTFYPKNDYRNYLEHHGVKGMHWGRRKDYIPHPRMRAHGQTLMSKLTTEAYNRRMDRKRERFERRNPGHTSRMNELTKRSDELYNAAYNKFFSDKKYKNDVINFIAKKDRSDAKFWSESLKAKDVKDRYPENLGDAINLYERETNPEYADIAREIGELAKKYHKGVYGRTFGNY